MTEPTSFDITWRNGAYYVSVPNYQGGKVYTHEVVQQLVVALMQARARIEYLGAACNDPRHFEANAETFLPHIDGVLRAVGQQPDRGK